MILRFFLVTLYFFALATGALADTSPDSAPASPKKGWGDFTVTEESTEKPIWQQILLWPVNRVVDLWDIFRLDAGVGVSRGGVLRLSRHAQMGYRKMTPGALRVGAFGRNPPAIIETSDEHGFGSDFVQSDDREVCDGEVGAGLDIFLIGAYGGICLDEVADFALGIFFLDPMDDDIR